MKSKTKKVTLVSLLASFVMAFACAFLPANVTAQAEEAVPSNPDRGCYIVIYNEDGTIQKVKND